MHDLDGFDRDLVAACFEAGPFDFVDPCFIRMPAKHRLALLVLEHDRDVAAILDAVDDIHVPVPELSVGRVPTLQRQVRVLSQPRQLSHIGFEVGTFAVVDSIAFSSESTYFTESACTELVDDQLKVKSPQRIASFPGWHESILLCSIR